MLFECIENENHPMPANNVSMSKEPRDYRQIALMGAAGVFFLTAFAFKLLRIADDSTAEFVYNVALRVGILVFATGLAWPQLMALRRSSYGRLMIIGLAATTVFLVVLPRSKTAVVPIVVVSIVVLIAVTFLRDIFYSPPKRK